MVKGETSTGFAYELPEDAFDDYELLEVLRKIDKGESGYVVDMIDMLFSKEQITALKEHIRKENGKVSARALMQEVGEIFQNAKNGKN